MRSAIFMHVGKNIEIICKYNIEIIYKHRYIMLSMRKKFYYFI